MTVRRRTALAGAALLVTGATVTGVVGVARSTERRTPSVAVARRQLRGQTPREHLQVLRLRTPGSPTTYREVWVYRPAVPDSPRLPVFYFLHGLPGSPADLADADIAATLHSYFAGGGRPFVLVAPDGNGTEHDDTEWADSVDGRDQVETFVLRTVIPAVEGKNRREPRLRAIGGFSMGGYGAMNIALRHPDLFGQVATVAGYFTIDDPDEVFGREPAVEDRNRPDRHAGEAAGMRLLLVEDEGDPLRLVRGEAARMSGLLRAAGATVQLRIQPGHHNWGFVRQQYPAILDFLARGWASA